MTDTDGMNKRQRVLADFGEFALRSDDLDAVLTEACRLVAEALDTTRAKVLEIEDEGTRLFVRAGIGWNPEIVGRLRLEMSDRSSETYSIEVGVPVITNDIALENRFVFPAFLIDAGVRAICNVPIFLPGGRAFGLLQVDAVEPRSFDDVDSQFLRTYATILGPVIDRLVRVKAMQESEARMRALADASAEALFVVDPRWGKMRQISTGGFLPDGGEQTTWLDAHVAEADRVAVRAAIDRAIRSKEALQVEHRARAVDGGIRWTSLRAVPVVGADGEILEWFGAAADVTVRRQTEQRKEFVLTFGDELRPMRDAAAAADAAIRLVGEHLGLEHVHYVEVGEGERGWSRSWHRPGAEPAPGRSAIVDAGLANGSGDATRVIADAIAEKPSDALAAACIRDGVAAAVHVRIARDGGRSAILIGAQSSPRAWTPTEIGLFEAAAERTWLAVERIRAEAARREREIRLAATVANAPVGISELTADGRFLAVNEELCRILGRSKVDLLKLGVADVTHPDDLAESRDAVSRALGSGLPVSVDKRYRRPDGSSIWATSIIIALRGVDHEASRLLAVTIDLTERREAERRVRENEERLRLALEAGRLATWDTNLATGKVDWSEHYYSMLGYAEGEVEPSVDAWLARVHPEDRDATIATRAAACTERTDYACEFRVVRPDGETRWCSARGRFFYDNAGKAIRMIGVMDDITERRSFEETQAVLIAELQHRTKNIIAVVSAMTTRSIAQSASLDDFKARFIGRLAALARAQNLLSGRGAGGRVLFDEFVRAELAGVGALDEKAHAGQVGLNGPRGVRLRSGHVQTFALGLHELATNALKYGALSRPEGRLTVSWRVEATDDGQRELVVEWRETGMRLDLAAEDDERRRGYGRELIERALAYQLGARTEFEFRPEGVSCSIALPLDDEKPRG